MILFVFEGANREPTLFKTLEFLYFSNKKETRICSYNNNIYNLYKQMTQSDFPEDIITILKKKLVKDKDNPLNEIECRSDFSEIYLFFDYDSHNNTNQELSDKQIKEMLQFFNDESSDYGKLFINYPMVESISYAKKELPDNDYFYYTTPISLGKKFKEKVNNESFYKNLDFITFRINKKTLLLNVPNDEKCINIVKKNWNYLLDMNVKKANYLCTNEISFPKTNESVSQQKIFENQLLKYVQPRSEISILNSFPLFIYEYMYK